jgi:recombinational DNA repair protein (RecF pathway)
MSWKKRKVTERSKYTKLSQCLICKKIREIGFYTSDGELVCLDCCEWLKEEGRKVNEL